jgi:flagellar biosynthetic protein FliS
MRAVNAYRRSSVENAPNEELIVLLVENAVQRIDRADGFMQAGDRSEWNRELHFVRAIFLELLGAFDADAPSEVAGPVCTTYRWIIAHAQIAARDGDRAELARVREVAATMLDTWTRALSVHREGPAPEAA